MNRKKKIIIIACIAIVIAVILCAFIQHYYKEKNNNADIVLSTTAGINFDWECKMDDKDIATVAQEKRKGMDPDVDGGEVQIRYRIKGVKEGKTRFICNYMDYESNQSIETNIYGVFVDKDLNVEIVNN